MRIEGVIRDGQTDFEMFNVEFVDRLGPLIGTLRAPVDENGRLSGMFMSRGSRVVATRIQFADDVAEGVYSNEYCTAKITLRKG